MDESTFVKLKESEIRSPEITDVIYDISQIEGLTLAAINSAKKGFNAVWDKMLFKYHYNYLKAGFDLLERLIEERHLKIRLIVEATTENIDLINSIKYYDIRHLDNVRGNFGILDERAYMIYIFHKNSERPEQAFFSNSHGLIDKQLLLFEKLWEIAVPIPIRNKELVLQGTSEFQKTFSGLTEMQKETNSLIEQSKKEIIIFSCIKILNLMIQNNKIWELFSFLLKKDINIKILTDDFSSDLVKQISEINSINKNNPIQIEYTNKIGNFKEFVIISDGKYLLEIN